MSSMDTVVLVKESICDDDDEDEGATKSARVVIRYLECPGRYRISWGFLYAWAYRRHPYVAQRTFLRSGVLLVGQDTVSNLKEERVYK